MARLTNRQMEVLAERVTDLLEEQHKLDNKIVKESKEYKHFEELYTDPEVEALRKIVKEYTENEVEIERLKDLSKQLQIKAKKLAIKCGTASEGSYYTSEPKVYLEGVLNKIKKEKFKGVEFDRDKTLRRVQADILLSDVQNPEELVKSLVEKLKDNGK